MFVFWEYVCIYLRIGLLGHRAGICEALTDTVKQVPSHFVPIFTLTRNGWAFQLLQILSNVWYYSTCLVHFSQPGGCCTALWHHCPEDSWGWAPSHIYVGHLDICFCQPFVQVFGLFFYCVTSVFLMDLSEFLPTLAMSPLSDICFTDTFSR